MQAIDLLSALLVVLTAAAISAALTWALRPVLLRVALARPNARSSHRIPTPQGAGVAVLIATLAAGAGALVLLPGAVLPWTIVAATVLIAAVGAVDDVRPIPVIPRLLLQAVAVGAVLTALPAELQLIPALPLWIERAVLLIAGLWFVNLVNFMDGLDWMTVAETLPITAALLVLGLAGDLPAPAALAAAALGGAVLGFAPFNRPVAKIFLGDVGSLPIGLLLGWCLLELALRQHLAAALLLPLYYLADSTMTLLRRLIRREPFWLAHRSHFYQRATDNGFTVIEVVGWVFATNLVLALLAWLSIRLQSTAADVVLLLAGAAIVALLLRRFATPRR